MSLYAARARGARCLAAANEDTGVSGESLWFALGLCPGFYEATWNLGAQALEINRPVDSSRPLLSVGYAARSHGPASVVD